MRTLLLVVLGTLGWGCQSAPVEPSTATATSRPPFPPPLIYFDHVGSSTIEGGTTYRYAEFRMVNVSRETVYYYGYEGIPFFQVATRSGEVWTSRPIWRCGNGLAPHEIPAGGVRTFQVADWRWSGDAVRACVFFAADRPRGGGIEVWSDVAPTGP